MAKTDTHKQAAATLRWIADHIETLNDSQAHELAKVARNHYAVFSAMSGKFRKPQAGKRGRKPQDNKTLADIMTDAAPVELAGMVARWAQGVVKCKPTKSARLLAALAVGLVEVGYIIGDNQITMYNALLGVIPLSMRYKFGKPKSFSNAYRQLSNPKIFPDKANNYRGYIERLKAYLKAP